jgi:hypothetical protein
MDNQGLKQLGSIKSSALEISSIIKDLAETSKLLEKSFSNVFGAVSFKDSSGVLVDFNQFVTNSFYGQGQGQGGAGRPPPPPPPSSKSGRAVKSSPIQGGLKSLANKLMIPTPGNILTGLLAIIIHGFKDKQRVTAEAGEIKNILVSAVDGGLNSITRSATKALSQVQESLHQYYGVHRKEIQGVVQAFVEGGVPIKSIEKSAGEAISGVGDKYRDMSLALDLFMEVPGGTSARQAVSYMKDYSYTFEEANKSVMKMVSAGISSGMGIQTFLQGMEGIQKSSKIMGYDIDSLISLHSSLQKSFESSGLGKQMAGRLAFEGMNELLDGMSGMSDSHIQLIAERMGYGSGVSGIVKFKESWERILSEKDSKAFAETIAVKWDITAIRNTDLKGQQEIDKNKFDFSKLWGRSALAAKTAEIIHGLVKSGKMDEAAKVAEEHMGLFKSAAEIEKEKTEQFQLQMNRWLKGMSELGQGLLGLLVKALASIIGFVRAIPALLASYITPGGEEKREKIFGVLGSYTDGIGEDINLIKSSFTKLKEGGSGMLEEVFGDNLDILVSAISGKSYSPGSKVKVNIPSIPRNSTVANLGSSNMPDISPQTVRYIPIIINPNEEGSQEALDLMRGVPGADGSLPVGDKSKGGGSGSSGGFQTKAPKGGGSDDVFRPGAMPYQASYVQTTPIEDIQKLIKQDIKIKSVNIDDTGNYVIEIESSIYYQGDSGGEGLRDVVPKGYLSENLPDISKTTDRINDKYAQPIDWSGKKDILPWGKHTDEDKEALSRMIASETGYGVGNATPTESSTREAAMTGWTALNRSIAGKKNKDEEGFGLKNIITGGKDYGLLGSNDNIQRPYGTRLKGNKHSDALAEAMLSGKYKVDPTGGAQNFHHSDLKSDGNIQLIHATHYKRNQAAKAKGADNKSSAYTYTAVESSANRDDKVVMTSDTEANLDRMRKRHAETPNE